MADEDAHQQFEALLNYLRSRRGFDFTGYKRPSLMRRVGRRLQALGAEGYEDYQDYLEVHPEEFALLFDAILINVTAFFRDMAAWDYLAPEILPRLIASKSEADPLRVWCAGCSSGEEAYTLAIVFAEALGLEAFRQRVKIYATDIDEGALAQARAAAYTAKDVAPVAEGLRERYFEQIGNRFVVRPDLRRSVIFGRNDLAQDAPISHLDVISCRNTLMYFNSEAQTRILSRFHFALNDKGYLLLGRAEMLLTHTNLFTPLSLNHRIFTKLPTSAVRDRLAAVAPAAAAPLASHVTRQVRLRDAAFDYAPVAQVVIDLGDTLVMANAQARALLGLTSRDIGTPFRNLTVSHKPVELRSIIEDVAKTRRPASIPEVEWTTTTGQSHFLDVGVMPLQANGGELVGLGFYFKDVTAGVRLRLELERASHELETAYEELQSTNEELETTNEELQSTNEELETTNEELQSANEELETMNEELQSTNEELRTMNDELRVRTIEGSDANAFLQSVLAGLNEGVIALDRQFAVTSWNDKASDMWGLRPEEVQGQSLLGLDIGLPLEGLQGPARAILAAGSASAQVVVDATNRRGKAIKCQVTLTPRLGPSGDVRGVILLVEQL